MEDMKNMSLEQKYRALKKKHPDAILLFRIGDFYETYMEDAKIISKVLGITVTTRKEGAIAGFPFYALDNYLVKLIENSDRNGGKYGYGRVAICEEFKDKKITHFQMSKNGEITWERKNENSVAPKEALDSHRDFWVKRWQSNGYYPITHYVWHEECQQHDTRWKKLRPFEPSPWNPKELYEYNLYMLENNPYIISFSEMHNPKQYNNE